MSDSTADKRFIVVLNRGYELSRLASGLGHVTAGLVASQSAHLDDLAFVEYKSQDGQVFPWISDWPFIVLKARGGQLRTLRTALRERELPCVTYLDTMLSGGSRVQQENTAGLPEDQLTLLAVGTFGEREVLAELTKKFSLWT
jgi:hypothetical protein